MKIWYGYGSEHSNNLVMIGHFKSIEDAKETQKLIEHLSEELSDKIDPGISYDRFGDNVSDLLRKENCYVLSPSELGQFLYEANIRVEGNKIILTTEEFEISAFFKLMINNGAKVEIYSAHNYPDTEYGRGK